MLVIFLDQVQRCLVVGGIKKARLFSTLGKAKQ